MDHGGRGDYGETDEQSVRFPPILLRSYRSTSGRPVDPRVLCLAAIRRVRITLRKNPRPSENPSRPMQRHRTTRPRSSPRLYDQVQSDRGKTRRIPLATACTMALGRFLVLHNSTDTGLALHLRLPRSEAKIMTTKPALTEEMVLRPRHHPIDM